MKDKEIQKILKRVKSPVRYNLIVNVSHSGIKSKTEKKDTHRKNERKKDKEKDK